MSPDTFVNDASWSGGDSIRIRAGVDDGLHPSEEVARTERCGLLRVVSTLICSFRLAAITAKLGTDKVRIALSTSGGGVKALVSKNKNNSIQH